MSLTFKEYIHFELSEWIIVFILIIGVFNLYMIYCKITEAGSYTNSIEHFSIWNFIVVICRAVFGSLEKVNVFIHWSTT